MAQTISKPLPAVINVTTGSSNVLTKITIPKEATKITFQPRTNDAKVTFGTAAASLEDGGALGAAAYVTLAADAASELLCGSARSPSALQDWYVTSATGSTVVEVIVEGGVL